MKNINLDQAKVIYIVILIRISGLNVLEQLISCSIGYIKLELNHGLGLVEVLKLL